MEDRIAEANCRFLGPKRFPRDSNPRLQCSLVELNTNPPICMNASGATGDEGARSSNKPLPCREVKVSLTVASFANGRNNGPRHAEIKRQVVCYAPIILHEGAEEFPSPTRGSAQERLVVDPTGDLSQKKIRGGVPCGRAEDQEEAVLESVGLNVHLVGANPHANTDVVLAANHVEGIGNGEHVGSTLEGRKTAIPQRPEAAYDRGAKAAADAVFS